MLLLIAEMVIAVLVVGIGEIPLVLALVVVAR